MGWPATGRGVIAIFRGFFASAGGIFVLAGGRGGGAGHWAIIVWGLDTFLNIS